jgi:hypothetical protein
MARTVRRNVGSSRRLTASTNWLTQPPLGGQLAKTAEPKHLTTLTPASTAPVTITAIGHRLLDVPAVWELFARGQDVVVRSQLALGWVTRTAVPGLASGGEVSFVAGWTG